MKFLLNIAKGIDALNEWVGRGVAWVTLGMLPGGEIFTSLERGVLDATEWVGPLHGLRFGFFKAAKYYYYPGWHEPGTYLEYFFNKKAYYNGIMPKYSLKG